MPQAWHSPHRPTHLLAVHPHSAQVYPGRAGRAAARLAAAVVGRVAVVEPVVDMAATVPAPSDTASPGRFYARGMEQPRVAGDAPRRRGRRAAGEDTREQIVAAARAEFVARGYDGASVRGIARRAGVDPGLVRYWFPGGKADLLTTSLMHPNVNPAGFVDLVLTGSVETIGLRLVAVVLGAWEVPGGPERLRLVIGAAVAGEDAGAVRDYISTEVLAKVARLIPGPDAHLRVSLAGSSLFGLLVARHVMRLEPLASAPIADVVKWAGPVLQRYFDAVEPAQVDAAWLQGPPSVPGRPAAGPLVLSPQSRPQ